MIKVNKTNVPPPILLNNGNNWKTNLLELITRYGSIGLIPKNKKSTINSRYKHPEIKELLLNCSKSKCVYCETRLSRGGYIEIDHFAPKSLYPDLTYDWNNLLPSCRHCNNSKGAYDTINEPIINPCEEDPEDYFDYRDLKIITSSSSPDSEKSERTIKVCQLNKPNLYKPRSELLLELENLELTLNRYIEDYNSCDTTIKKNNMLYRLNDVLYQIESLRDPDQNYSGFAKSFIRRSSPIQTAKNLIENSNLF